MFDKFAIRKLTDGETFLNARKLPSDQIRSAAYRDGQGRFYAEGYFRIPEQDGWHFLCITLTSDGKHILDRSLDRTLEQYPIGEESLGLPEVCLLLHVIENLESTPRLQVVPDRPGPSPERSDSLSPEDLDLDVFGAELDDIPSSGRTFRSSSAPKSGSTIPVLEDFSTPAISLKNAGPGLVLFPRVSVTGFQCRLEFVLISSFGTPWQIENLYAFIDCLEHGHVLAFGQRQNRRYLSREMFSGASLRYADFLADCLHARMSRNLIQSSEEPSALLLDAREADLFADILLQNEVPARTRDDHPVTPVNTGRGPSISSSLEADTDDSFVQLSMDTKGVQFFEGIQNLYGLADTGTTVRLEIYPIRTVGGRLITLLREREKRFRIRKRDLPGFFFLYAPALEECGTLSAGEDISRYRLPRPSYELFFEEGRKAYTFRLESVYREGDSEERFQLLPTRPITGDGSRYPKRIQIADKQMRDVVLYILRIHDSDADESAGKCQIPMDSDTLGEFFARMLPELESVCDVKLCSSLTAMKEFSSSSLPLQVTLSGGMLDISVGSEALSLSQIREILSRYEKKQRYYPLPEGGVLPLDGGLGEDAACLDFLLGLENLSDDGHLQIPAGRIFGLRSLSDRTMFSLQESETLKQFLDAYADPAPVPLPDRLQAQCLPYQEEGFQWLHRMYRAGFGALLADEMGLGKTLQVIAFLLSLKEQGEEVRALVIAPTSLLWNWEAELNRFAPDLRVHVSSGEGPIRRSFLYALGRETNPFPDVLITSYDLLRSDIAIFQMLSFHIFILDEAQAIKNHATQTAKLVKSLRGSFKAALTGTPVENRLSELWSIFDFLMPGLLFSYRVFRARIEKPVMEASLAGASAAKKEAGQKSMERLKALIAPFLLRRLRSDVLPELPPRIINTLVVRLEGEQLSQYLARRALLVDSLYACDDRTFSEDRMRFLAQVTELRQIICDPSLLLQNYHAESAKRRLVTDLIFSSIEGGHRIVVFSQFTSMLEILQEDLRQLHVPCLLLTGKTRPRDRLELTTRFSAGGFPVFLISLRAGGTGLNLTAADIVIHYDPWWNRAVEEQASDRVYRIGQDKPVTVYRLIARDTLEERIDELQAEKAKLAQTLLDASAKGGISFSREELLAILDARKEIEDQ